MDGAAHRARGASASLLQRESRGHAFVWTPAKLSRAVAAAVSLERAFLDTVGGWEALQLALDVDPTRGILARGSDHNRNHTTNDDDARRRWFGCNYVAPAPRASLLQLMLASAFRDSTNALLLGAGALSMALGLATGSSHSSSSPSSSASQAAAWVEGGCVIAAVGTIVLVTALTEHRKESQFEALREIRHNPMVHVVRGAMACEITARELLVGDVVVLHTGDVVPADGVLFISHELFVDESALTGEPEHVAKQPPRDVPLEIPAVHRPVDAIEEEITQVRGNVMLAGTTVMAGSGSMLVVGVGRFTQENVLLRLARGEASNDSERTTNCSSSYDDTGEPREGTEYRALASPSSAQSSPPTPDKKKKQSLQADSDNDDDNSDRQTPLARQLAALMLAMGRVGAILATLVFVVLSLRFSLETFRGSGDTDWYAEYLREYVSFFILSVTILVVAIPEALPLAVVLALTVAVRRMLRDHSLVRHLYACETAGNATILCADKTGTLTTSEMRVSALWLGHDTATREAIALPSGIRTMADLEPATARLLAMGIAINSTAELLQPEHELHDVPVSATGNPTECALLRYLHEQDGDLQRDYRELRACAQVVRALPFSSDRKRMSTIVRIPSDQTSLWCFTKGAPEAVLPQCSHQRLHDGRIVALDDEAHYTTQVASAVNAYASQGARVLCLAYRTLPEEEAKTHEQSTLALESQLILLAVVAIADPLRPETSTAISLCHAAGVRVCMVTGDNLLTGTAVARACGILSPEHDASIAMEPSAPTEETQELAIDARAFRARVLRTEDGSLDQDAFDALWPSLRVLARATPQDKLTLVRGLRTTCATHHGPQLVAVTGDGTNDAPALRAAHIGFAMGRRGTEVAKRASDVVVLDDSMLSIVRAIQWGRNVYDAIARFLQFQLTVIGVAVTVAVGGSLVLEHSPLSAVQILWVNFLMDAFVSLALATEAPRESVLNGRAPMKHGAPLLSNSMRIHIAAQCGYQLLVLILLIAVGDWMFNVPSGHGTVEASTGGSVHMTLVFHTFAWLQLWNQFNCRCINGESGGVLRGITANPAFLFGWPLQAALQALVVQFGGTLFHCVALTAAQWLACVGLAAPALLLGWLLRHMKC